VQQFWAKIDYDVDINPPNPPVHEVNYLMAGGEDELAALVEQTIADLTTNPQVINVAPTLKGPLYWLLDKTNLDLILLFAGNQAMQLIDQFGSYPNYVYSGPNDNPRSGWTDDDGVKREPTPSDKKTSVKQTKIAAIPVGFVDFATFIAMVYATLLQQIQAGGPTGQAASIWAPQVKRIMDRFLNGKITAREAKRELVAIGIPGISG